MEYHCGVCGFTLEWDDDMCPACGGTPVDEDGNDK